MHIPGFDPTGSATREQIEGAELLLGIRFPSLYHDFIARYGGVYGDADFPVPGTEYPASVGLWLSLSPWERQSLWSILASWSEHELPPKIVPFGLDGGGNLLCFDYRLSPNPKVAFWYHELEGEDGLHLISETFEGFLGTLREPSDD